MSEHKEIPIPCKRSSSHEFTMPCASPSHHTLHLMGLTSPVPRRRPRTISQSELTKQGPSFEGTVTWFCREKGHGFIRPDGEEEDIFAHVSEIEEDFVPRKGDRVSFNKMPVPPKNTKTQAVHVIITHATHESHDRWSPRKLLLHDDHHHHHHDGHQHQHHDGHQHGDGHHQHSDKHHQNDDADELQFDL